MIRTVSLRLEDGHELPVHEHDTWGQLVFAAAGVVRVETPDGTWVIPPRRAVWVAPGRPHTLRMRGAVALRTLYLAPALAARLPGTSHALDVVPLLRELILHAASRGAIGAEGSALADVIVERIAAAPPAAPLRLPRPQDPRARRVAARLENGADEPLEDVCRAAGASRRTLERVFLVETGLTLGRWRQRLRLLHGLQLLADGEPVTRVALRVGYESPSAFIAVFKRELGVTPGRYYDMVTS